MIKKILLTLVISTALLIGEIAAQNKVADSTRPTAKYECLYSYSVTLKNDNIEEYSTILQIGDNTARFMDYSAYELDSVSNIAGVSKETIDKYELQMEKNDRFFDQTVYQNEPKDKITIYSMIATSYYSYEEGMNPVSWKLCEETDTVCGYACKKAVGEYGGRKWVVWYAPEIPVQFGPWKLCGLPGLIMAASDSENIHHFSATAFRKGESLISLPNYPNTTSIQRNTFIKSKNKFEQNPLKNIPVESVGDIEMKVGDGGTRSIFINGVRIRLRPNGYIPLELQ